MLKWAGAAGAVGAGLATGTASANEGNELIEMPPAEMAATVEERAPELLENLHDNEVMNPLCACEDAWNCLPWERGPVC